MEWYLIDKDYLNYLREFDQFVPNIEGYDGKFKPFFGKIFSTDNLDYYAPISSGKNKHILLRETSFFYKTLKIIRMIQTKVRINLLKKIIQI